MSKEQQVRSSREDRRLLIVIAVLTTVAFGGGFSILVPAFLPNVPGGVAIALGIALGVLLGLTLGVLLARLWKRSGGRAAGMALHRALRTRTLPADADPDLWADLLDRQEKDTRRAGGYVLFFLTVAALYLVVALTDALPDLGIVPWVGVVVFAAFGLYAPIEARSRRERTRSLREQLQPPRGQHQGVPRD